LPNHPRGGGHSAFTAALIAATQAMIRASGRTWTARQLGGLVSRRTWRDLESVPCALSSAPGRPVLSPHQPALDPQTRSGCCDRVCGRGGRE
jgi:hypothetical protein